MTNQTDIPPAIEMNLGVNLDNLKIDDTPHWHEATWELLVVVGFFAIIISFWRGWINYKKGVATKKCLNTIAIATTLIITSSLINFLFAIADWLDLITSGTLSSYTTGCQMLLAIVSQESKHLGFSIGLATIGVILYILLPTGKREIREP